MTKTLFGRSRDEIAGAFTRWEEVLCPLCEGPSVKFAVDYQGFHLSRCHQCQLEFLNPRPVQEQLARNIYGESYFEATPASPDCTTEQILQFSHQLKRIEELLGRTGTLLDVGCGTGAFLRFAKDRNWNICGTDIHLAAQTKSLNCRLFEGDLLEIDFGSEKFDVIRFNHVLEHTSDPLRQLIRARNVLAYGGVIFVSVPNLAGISAHLKGLQSRLHLKSHAWRHYAALHHLWFFRPGSLARICERAGLQVVRWETPVLKKQHQKLWMWKISRVLLEKPRLGSILDFYCRVI